MLTRAVRRYTLPSMDKMDAYATSKNVYFNTFSYFKNGFAKQLEPDHRYERVLFSNTRSKKQHALSCSIGNASVQEETSSDKLMFFRTLEDELLTRMSDAINNTFPRTIGASVYELVRRDSSFFHNAHTHKYRTKNMYIDSWMQHDISDLEIYYMAVLWYSNPKVISEKIIERSIYYRANHGVNFPVAYDASKEGRMNVFMEMYLHKIYLRKAAKTQEHFTKDAVVIDINNGASESLLFHKDAVKQYQKDNLKVKDYPKDNEQFLGYGETVGNIVLESMFDIQSII